MGGVRYNRREGEAVRQLSRGRCDRTPRVLSFTRASERIGGRAEQRCPVDCYRSNDKEGCWLNP